MDASTDLTTLGRDLRHLGWVLSCLALAGPGCTTCGPWEDVEVTSSVADPEASIEKFWASVETFRGWTGRTETCIARVEVVPDAPDMLGRYDDARRIVELEPNIPASVPIHELCHALDHEEEWASQQGAEILAPYGIYLDPDVYPEEEHVNEVFARFCELGPEVAAVMEELNRLCGVEDPWLAMEFVREVAFPEDSSSTGWGEMGVAFEFEAADVTVDGTERVAASQDVVAARGADGVYVLTNALFEASATELRAEPEILLLDPSTFEVVESLALAPDTYVAGDANAAARALFGSSTSPIVYQYAGDQAGSAWRVEPDPLRLTPVRWPAMEVAGMPRGFESEGRVLVSVGAEVQIVDLEAETVTPFLGDEGLPFDGVSPKAFFADEQGAIGVFTASGGPVVAALDRDGALSWQVDLPIRAERMRSVLRLSDGTVVVTLNVPGTGSISDVDVSYHLSIRYDPASGAWSPAAGDCAAFNGDGWVVTEQAAARPASVETASGAREVSFATRVFSSGGR